MALRILDLAARLLLALGLGCLILAGYLSTRTLAFSNNVARATGEVVSYREIADGDKKLQRPRIRFETSSGEIVNVDGQFFTASKRFEIGQRVPVIYKLRNPTEARVALFVDNWLGASISLGVGVLAFLAGMFIRKAAKRDLDLKNRDSNNLEPKK